MAADGAHRSSGGRERKSLTDETARQTEKLLKSTGGTILSWAHSLNMAGKAPRPAPPPGSTVTPENVVSDLSALLPSIRHDLTALSLALSLDQLQAAKPETFQGASTIIRKVGDTARRIFLATTYWDVRWGGHKEKELRWGSREVLAVTGELLKGLPRVLDAMRGRDRARAEDERQGALKAVALAWEVVDKAAAKVKWSERDCLKAEWTNQQTMVEDALEELSDAINNDEELVDPLIDVPTKPLTPKQAERAQVAIPILKLLRLLVSKLASGVTGNGPLSEALAGMDTASLDLLAEQTDDLVSIIDALVPELIYTMSDDEDEDEDDARADVDHRELAGGCCADLVNSSDRAVRTLVGAASDVDRLAEGVDGLAVTGVEREARARKAPEWVDTWSVQLHKAVDRLSALCIP